MRATLSFTATSYGMMATPRAATLRQFHDADADAARDAAYARA